MINSDKEFGIGKYYIDYLNKTDIDVIRRNTKLEIENYGRWAEISKETSVKAKSRDIHIIGKENKLKEFVDEKFMNYSNGSYKEVLIDLITKYKEIGDSEEFDYNFFDNESDESDILFFSLILLPIYRRYMEMRFCKYDVGIKSGIKSGIKPIPNINAIEELYYETVSDIYLRLNSYYEKSNGKFGIYWEDGNWLSRIFCFKIFKIGSLQYEIIRLDLNKFGIKYNLEAGNNPGLCMCLSVHIMKGVDFSTISVDKSLKRAKTFFREFFKDIDFKYFYCFSWMLYSGNKDFLPKESKILDFASRFNIVTERNFNQYALISIFGMRPDFNNFDTNIDSLDEEVEVRTSLQRRAIENLTSLGVAEGLIEFDKVNLG